MSLHETLKKLRINRGYSQKELGDLLGLSKQAISMYERGERSPDTDMLVKIADVFCVDLNYLFNRPIRTALNFADEKNTIQIPVIGKVAAGIPIEAIQDVIDYEEISADMLRGGAEYFALQIQGDSMEPKISNKDVVIVRKQPDVDSNDIAIIAVNGCDATCKRVMKQADGILLVPSNPAYAPVFYSNQQIAELPITILGKVVELRAKF